MVLDTLANADRYLPLNPHFAQAFEFLRRPDLADLPAGRHEIAGPAVFAIVSHEPGRGHGGATREAHRNYLDIQFAIVGTDQIGHQPTAEAKHVLTEYDAAKDVATFADEPQNWILVPPGSYLILWPEDTHAPLGGSGPLHKVIVKVAVA
ncbi:MAG: YhcH/YjgK/YiaL family protein [Fimbriimonadaceae bacterium]|nr:YhcH/YjgK/YiaL family protein [Fimbriimonadaceae bacterium]